MKKVIYIHIGAHKTGTSAIQEFLSNNREILRKRGYLYLCKKNACYDLTEELLTNTHTEITQNANSPLKHYMKQIEDSEYNTVILSSEGFMKILKDEINLLKQVIPKDYSVNIIVYVRQQDEKIESDFNQRVRGPSFRYEKKFYDNIPELLDLSFCDYYSVLIPWSQAFGKENIKVRCYEKEQLPKGVYHDFLEAIGLCLDEKFHIPKEIVNQSLNWDLIEFIRLCNIKFKDDIRFHNFLVKNLTLINKGYKEKNQRLLSPQQRIEIIEKYKDSTAKVARW